ncbi:MAG: lysylphosphatidylglycerol synthase transmembrane domain-containing protein [Alphaproteobacteria bacterium]|nr:lysylphosphatidylglycerol synthase transmembrane domain-containing protein [Alphaproteobacteria bacterium]
MKFIPKLLLVCLGLVLLWLVVRDLDLSEVGAQLRTLGAGIVLVLAINTLAYSIDTVSWHVMLAKVPFRFSGFWELWKIRMIGSSYNQTVPVVGIGGEPLKVVLLKRSLGIGYRDSAASLIVFQTTKLLSLVAVAIGGYVVALALVGLPSSLSRVAPIGVGVFTAVVAAFFLFQRFRIASVIVKLFHRGWLRTRLVKALSGIREVEDLVVRFYTTEHARFATAFTLTTVHVMLGAFEVYTTAWLLGHPMDFWSSWVVVALVEVVKVGTFFIPISLGAQDGAMVLVVGAITGNPTLGLSLAVVRRIREFFMILWGFAIGWRYTFQRRMLAVAQGSETLTE